MIDIKDLRTILMYVFLWFVALLLSVAVLDSTSACQTSNLIPRPYLFTGLDLNGGGYQPAAVIVGGGIDNEYDHWWWHLEGMWDNAKKVNDNTGQHSGYTERAGVHGFVRFGDGWYAGAGTSYTFLHTKLYDKNAWHPRAGFGRDTVLWKVPGRYQLEYVFPGTDTVNAVQGFETTVLIPQYRNTQNHWFFRERLGTYWFHTTVTSTDPVLTIQQQHQRSVFSELQFTLEYRF